MQLMQDAATGDGNADATALPDLTTKRVLSDFSAATPWKGNVPLLALGAA